MIAYKLVVRSCYTCPGRGVEQRPRCLEFLIKYVNVGYEPGTATSTTTSTPQPSETQGSFCAGSPLSLLSPTQASAAQRDEYSISSIYTHLAGGQLQPPPRQLMAS